MSKEPCDVLYNQGQWDELALERDTYRDAYNRVLREQQIERDKFRWRLLKMGEVEAELGACRAALADLVALKEVKDTQGKTLTYQEHQPKAWAKAREVLGWVDVELK